MRRLIVLAVFALSSAPALAQTYTYTARTAAPAQQTGEVQAGSITWSCSDRACTVSGPWPQPGVGACAQLAAIVGRVSEYGHPGARLNSAQLEQCNANAARPALQTTLAPGIAQQVTTALTPQVRAPELQVQPQPGQRVSPQQIPDAARGPAIAPPEMQVELSPTVRLASTAIRYGAPLITNQTVHVEIPPTERLYAIRNGGGDGDFGGNGPRVTVSASISAEGPCLIASIDMDAVETRPDHTRGRVSERLRLWCNPEGGDIQRITSPTRASAEYTDSDWEIDTIVPGRGEIDVRRGLPETDGPVRSFIIMGDTNGDVFNNDNDGRDVGDLDSNGNRTVSRTSVQVQWNPISVVVPIVAEPEVTGPPGTTSVWVNGQHSGFLVLRHTGGDRDFFGHGPRMTVTSRLDLSADGTQILARLAGDASEVGGDTRASGSSDREVIWTAPAGWRIDAVQVEYGWWEDDAWQQAFETALGRTATVAYTDRDHEQDFLVEGAGEGGRDGIWFDDATNDARRRAMSHVEAFRVMGDANGDEAGSRTGLQAFYRPLLVTLTPVDPARARTADLQPDVLLDVPTGDFANRLSGGNSCGPQAASRVLRFYGVATTYEQFKRRVQSSGNFVSDQSLGTPPGTLRDRMNDLASGFVHDVLPLGNTRANDAALARIRQLLDEGRPVLTLVAWGSQYAADIISPHDAAATAHWVVVRGYNARNRTFLIIDNGHPVEWSYEHFASMFDYGQDAQFEALFALMNVEKGSIIYRR
ncbi:MULTISPECIES: CC_3452 family protein [Hyphobacterium]|uniref:C39 family peptidase n=1 Tax=Hyphobacterium vulgare TaxID=1736751 RepID=A0ABV6ZZU0_9PROT